MNATAAWRYQLLNPDEQRAFRRFGALPGLFPIDAAIEVLAGSDAIATEPTAALRAAAALMDKSLLLRAETSVVATCPLYYMPSRQVCVRPCACAAGLRRGAHG